MEKTVTFAPHQPPPLRNDTDVLVCWFDFSVIDSSLIGTPRQRAIHHSLKITMTKKLRERWEIDTPRGSAVSSGMVKVAFQVALEHIGEQLQKGLLPEGDLPSLSRDTSNSEDSCPYDITNIAYPDKTEFRVPLNDPLKNPDLLDVHSNIRVLMNRLDDALTRRDFSGVLHASASIFETMAKDVVGIPSVQDQTLKSFFDRYRKDSNLPKAILDYILGVYDLRNTTPLAGHGSTQDPAMNPQAAISLVEMTKAFIRIEYRLRQTRC